jgi:hypothetical protein
VVAVEGAIFPKGLHDLERRLRAECHPDGDGAVELDHG